MNERAVVTVGANAGPNWRDRGLCRTNPDLFFPEATERKKSVQGSASA